MIKYLGEFPNKGKGICSAVGDLLATGGKQQERLPFAPLPCAKVNLLFPAQVGNASCFPQKEPLCKSPFALTSVL